MSLTKTIGGNRLGSGKKMKVELKAYERSTHNLGYKFRTTISPGTLVPFMSRVALPGDTWDLELDADVLTHPTIGPLFGDYKLQVDTFFAPLRLYNSAIHNNMVGIGLKMQNVLLPKMRLPGITWDKIDLLTQNEINKTVSNSCILKYLGVGGMQVLNTNSTTSKSLNAVPLLAYWDIYGNYYANQQETEGVVIERSAGWGTISTFTFGGNTITTVSTTEYALTPSTTAVVTTTGYVPGLENQIVLKDNTSLALPILSMFSHWSVDGNVLTFWNTTAFVPDYKVSMYMIEQSGEGTDVPVLKRFPLTRINEMRTRILGTGPEAEYLIDATNENTTPYNAALKGGNWTGSNGIGTHTCKYKQQGLGVKTYQNDIFNNWLNSEWIANVSTGINAISAIPVDNGKVSVDALILGRKVYDVLNRIAISGGTYEDWVETVYTHKILNRTETPVYHGGLSKLLVFEEVISNSAAEAFDGEQQPLGTLAGRGRIGGDKKGGNVTIKCDEHGYIMGIVSLTPNISYSQGTNWDMWLNSWDDFHKPGLDQIGFQNLMQDQQAYWTAHATGNNVVTRQTTGKQPAWINYQTDYDRTYGDFAEDLDFMVLTRKYTKGGLNNNNTPRTIVDNTTYVDPAKYNYIFADSSLSAMNFWLQINVKATVRRKMSAKVMPNL